MFRYYCVTVLGRGCGLFPAAAQGLAVIHLLASRLRFAVDPRTAMPNLYVTERDARDIAAYLATLR